jgi:cytochrome c553
MKPILKWMGIALGAVAALVLVALAYVAVGSQLILDRTYQVATGSLHAATSSAAIARGAHFASIFGCARCHGKDLDGDLFFHGMGVTLYAPNLRLFVHSFSDADFDRALRHGVRPDGTSVLVMPSESFQYMPDDEAAAILGYLRSLPPKGALQPPPSLGMFARLGIVVGKFPTIAGSLADAHPAMDFGPKYRPGRHLAMVVCGGCHATNLSGSQIDPKLKTPDLAIVAAYDRGDFIKLMRTGKAAGNRELPLMSDTARETFRNFTDDEVGALYDYLVARGQKLAAAPPPR